MLLELGEHDLQAGPGAVDRRRKAATMVAAAESVAEQAAGQAHQGAVRTTNIGAAAVMANTNSLMAQRPSSTCAGLESAVTMGDVPTMGHMAAAGGQAGRVVEGPTSAGPDVLGGHAHTGMARLPFGSMQTPYSMVLLQA